MASLQLILILYIFLRGAQPASTPTVWTSSPYMRTGSFTFSTGVTGSFSSSGTVTYSSAMSAAPTRRVALGYIDLEYNVPSSNFYLDLENPVGTATASSFGFTMKANSGSSLKNLRIRYLALDQTFPHPFTFGYLTYSTAVPDVSPFAVSLKMNFTNSTGMVLNLAHDNAMLIFQHTFDLYSLSRCFQMEYSITILNASYYEALISSNCPDMELYALGASRIIFDKTSIEAGGYYYFQYGQILSYNSTPSTLTFTTSLFLNEAFMMGMRSYYIVTQPKMIFTSTINTVTTVASTMTYRKLTFMYLSMKFRTCPSGYPYFYLVTDLCYDVCPAGTYANVALAMCQACHYSCQTCTGYPACTNCDPATNRYLNGTSCLPSPGSFQNYTAIAPLCSASITNCSRCTSATVCTQCVTGSYLSGATCLLCANVILHCVECSSPVNCVTCGTGYSLNGTTSCVAAAVNVTCTDANCVTCATASICTNCTAGYTLTGTTCTLTCTDPNCVTCSSSSVCTNCTTGYTLSGTSCVNSTITCTDPNCIACSSSSICTNCTTGYTLSGTSCTLICSDPNCVTCSSSSVCTNCTTGYTLSGSSCVNSTITCTDPNCSSSSVCTNCTTGYTLTGTSCALTCTDPNCVTCSPSSVCSNCTTGYTLSGSSCTNSTVACSDPNCVTCSSSSVCTNCTTGYTLTGATCTLTCSDPNCVTCTTSPVCTNCTTGYTLTGTTCSLTCSDPNCLTCSPSPSTCTNCTTGYTLTGTTCTSSTPGSCTDTNCITCANPSICSACVGGYAPVNGLCVAVCGDGILLAVEMCDDGNFVDGDGCSMYCLVQDNFVCEPAVGGTGSACFYIGSISINTLYINKIDGQNKLQIKLQMQPLDLQAWNQVDFKSMITLTQPTQITDFSITRNPDGTVTLQLAYSGNIQKKDLVVQVDPALSGVPSLSRANRLSATINVVPSDNELAYYYDEGTYGLARVTGLVAAAVGWVGVGVFGLGVVCGKVVGVEMMAVLQVTFFAVGALQELNPCFAGLAYLWPSTGYNKMSLSSKTMISDTSMPPKFKGIQMFSHSLNNFNISLVLILIPLLLALIFLILSKAYKKDQKKSAMFQALSIKFAVEYTFTLLMFSCYLIAVCFGLELVYGMKDLTPLFAKISLVQCIILAGLCLVYFVLLAYKPANFGEFYTKFQAKPVYSRFYLAMITERWIIGLCLIFGLTSRFILVSVIAMCILFILLCLIFRPYAKLSFNIRLICNMLITAAIMGIFMGYGMAETESKGAMGIFMYLPLIVCLLLLVCVVYSAVFIGHSLVKGIRGKKYKQFAKKDEFQLEFMSSTKMPNELGLDASLLTGTRKLSLTPFDEQVSPRNLQSSLNLNKIKQQIRSMAIKNQIKRQNSPQSSSPLKVSQEVNFCQMETVQLEEYGQI